MWRCRLAFYNNFWLFFTALLAALAPPLCPAQTVNVWTKPASGYWEEPFWSLGRLPSADDQVIFTNSGWKALAIGSSTARDFPQSLQVRDITVASPVDSFNTLLLNFAGFEMPLHVSGRLTIEHSAALVVLSSALHVTNTGEFIVNGTVQHGDFSDVRTLTMHIGYQAPGIYYLSNGVLQMDHLIVDFQSQFDQEGGSSAIGTILLRNQGIFTVAGGQFVGGTARVGVGSSGVIMQSGGSAVWTGGVDLAPNYGVGTYNLSGGVLTTPSIIVGEPGLGEFVQSGGTNNVSSLFAGSSANSGRYTLSGGALNTDDTYMGGNGSMIQQGGTHTTGYLELRGEDTRNGPDDAGYGLEDGILITSNMNVRFGDYSQSGGSNFVSGNLFIEPEQWAIGLHLSGGLLTTSNTIVGGRHGAFTQSGGTHNVRGTLDLTGDRYSFPLGLVYDLSAGELRVLDLNLVSGILRHHGGTLEQTGVLSLGGARLEPAAGLEQLGTLQLNSGPPSYFYDRPPPSTIAFGSNSTVVRFRQSSERVWASNAVLLVQGWRGSTNGAGVHQFFVGTSSSGLTAQQLSQIVFNKPGNASGNYTAAILPTGEIVPARPIALQLARESNRWVLRWDPGYILQSATDIYGPYRDVPGATPPFEIRPTLPMEFFALRR